MYCIHTYSYSIYGWIIQIRSNENNKTGEQKLEFDTSKRGVSYNNYSIPRINKIINPSTSDRYYLIAFFI